VFLALDKFLSLAPSKDPKGCLTMFDSGESVAIMAIGLACTGRFIPNIPGIKMSASEDKQAQAQSKQVPD
jgi:hypothetical protein